MYRATSLLINDYISIRECSSKFFTRGVFSTCLLIYTHTHPHPHKYKYKDIHIYFFILDSGMRVNPTTISRMKIVLSLLMSKTNGPGMTFLVTLREEEFASYLEQHSTRNLQRSPYDGNRKGEPIRPGQNVPAPLEQRKHAEKIEHFSVTMALLLFHSFKTMCFCVVWWPESSFL